MRSSGSVEVEGISNVNRTFLALVLASVIPRFAAADASGDRPLPELYAFSEVVAKIQVIEIHAVCKNKLNCPGYVFVTEVQSVIKGDQIVGGSDKLEICSHIPLEIGAEYTVFLAPPTKYPIGLENCSLVLGRDAAFEKLASTTFRVNSPDSTGIHERDGARYRSTAIAEPDFDSRLEALKQGVQPSDDPCPEG
jgi:hypothetical protein